MKYDEDPYVLRQRILDLENDIIQRTAHYQERSHLQLSLIMVLLGMMIPLSIGTYKLLKLLYTL